MTALPPTTVGRQAPQPAAGDFYRIDSMLSAQERAVRDRVRRFVQERVLPNVVQHFAAETFPRELVPELAALGLFGMQIEGYGCAGLNAVCRGLASDTPRGLKPHGFSGYGAERVIVSSVPVSA